MEGHAKVIASKPAKMADVYRVQPCRLVPGQRALRPARRTEEGSQGTLVRVLTYMSLRTTPAQLGTWNEGQNHPLREQLAEFRDPGKGMHGFLLLCIAIVVSPLVTRLSSAGMPMWYSSFRHLLASATRQDRDSPGRIDSPRCYKDCGSSSSATPELP